MSHVKKSFSEGNALDFNISFDELYTQEEETMILQAIEKVGMEKLGPIKHELPYDITYDKINAVILKELINKTT